MNPDILAILNDAGRDPIGAPVLVAVLVLFLMTLANVAGWLFDEACGWYDRFSLNRERRQAEQYHQRAAAAAAERRRLHAAAILPDQPWRRS